MTETSRPATTRADAEEKLTIKSLIDGIGTLQMGTDPGGYAMRLTPPAEIVLPAKEDTSSSQALEANQTASPAVPLTQIGRDLAFIPPAVLGEIFPITDSPDTPSSQKLKHRLAIKILGRWIG